jgi:hypothetical protein
LEKWLLSELVQGKCKVTLEVFSISKSKEVLKKKDVRSMQQST